MAETLPSLPYPVYASYTEAVDLGGGNQHTWVSGDGGSPEERAFIRYDFTAAEGYTSRYEDCSVEGQAIHFESDLEKSVSSLKRQFVIGAYAYLLDKNFSFSGQLPNGEGAAYLSGTNAAGRLRLKRGVSEETLTAEERLFDNLQVGTYVPVDQLYICPRIGVTSNGLTVDESYSTYAEVRFSGVEGEFPPYLDVVAEDVVPSVTGAHPSDQFADPSVPITLSWQMTYDETRSAKFEGIANPHAIVGRVYGKLTQKSARVRWTVDGETIHEATVGSEGQYMIPSGMYGVQGFRWQVDVCTSDGVWSEPSDHWYQVSCVDDSVSTSVALRPQKVIIDGTVTNDFYWEQYNESGSQSRRAELQYSQDCVQWISFAESYGLGNSCPVAGDILPAGQVWWRVRTYNASDVAGPWSDPVPVTVRSAPQKPTAVLAGRTPSPLIQWNSPEQVAAEVKIGEKSHRVYGKTYQLRWPEVLLDGVHTVAVRVQNLYALWSEWTEVAVEIINYPQGNFQLNGGSVNESVLLSWNRSFYKVQVWRGESLLAELADNSLSHWDHESIGRNLYWLRGITEEGYYTDSNQIPATVNVNGSVIGKLGKTVEWIPLKGRYKAPSGHVCRMESKLEYRHYAAEQLPKLINKQQHLISHQMSFSVDAKELEQLEKIRALAGQQVIYKDARGELIYGILTEVVSSHRGIYIDVDFTIAEAKLEEGEL